MSFERAGVMPQFLGRVKNIMFRPGEEWQSIKEEQTTYRDVLVGYVAIIAAIPPVMAVAERLVFGSRISGSAPLGYIIAANILWYLVIIVNMVITGAVITAIVGSMGSGLINLRGLELAVYSYTPLFLVGILTIIPRTNWFIYPAILYSLYLLYRGIRSMTGVGQGKAAWHTAASFLAAAVIVGVLNFAEYMFESFIAGKMFF